jgi:multisubunit Na+/H+ antiporter MnhE subunit
MMKGTIIALAIIYFSIICVLGFIAYDILINEYPLVGIIIGAIAAACLTYWLKDTLSDFEPLPESVSALIAFILLVLFWPLTLAISITICATYIFVRLVSSAYTRTPEIRTIEEDVTRRYQLRPIRRKGPEDFIEEIRRKLENEHN